MHLSLSHTDSKIADIKSISALFLLVSIKSWYFDPPVFLHKLFLKKFNLLNISCTQGLGPSFTQISLWWWAACLWWHKGCLQHQDKDFMQDNSMKFQNELLRNWGLSYSSTLPFPNARNISPNFSKKSSHV